jgi:hypothetical protein
MRSARLLVGPFFILTLTGCGFEQLQKLDDQLNADQSKMVSTRQAGGNTAPMQQQLAQVARDAIAQATAAKNPKDAIAFYRIASVAAWQAGPEGTTLVQQATDGGAAACDALPQKDKDAPRDCSLIRLAMPMAVQDETAVKLMALRKQRDDAQHNHDLHCQELQGAEATPCRATRGKLPATDLPTERMMFDDLKTQFTKVSNVRDNLRTLDVPPAFTKQTDAQRVIIYCNAVVAWRLTADTEGGADTFNELTPAKTAMAQQLQDSGVAANCDSAMSTQTSPPSM